MEEPLVSQKRKGNKDLYIEMHQVNAQTLGNTEHGMIVLKQDRELLEKAIKVVNKPQFPSQLDQNRQKKSKKTQANQTGWPASSETQGSFANSFSF